METNLKLAAELFARTLPQKPVDDDPDAAPIKIPWRRYVEIEDAVLKMYRRADARTMPLDVFEIALSLDCSPIPYRALGPQLYPALSEYSEDCAENRLGDLIRWEALEVWKRNRDFGNEVRQRFQLLEPYQTLMFQEKSSS